MGGPVTIHLGILDSIRTTTSYHLLTTMDYAGQAGFTPIANFAHEFFKPFAVTVDYTDMHVYIR